MKIMAKSLVFTRSVYPCFISQQHWNCETASIYLELVKHRYDSNCKKQRKGNANVTITITIGNFIMQLEIYSLISWCHDPLDRGHGVSYKFLTG